MICSGIVSIVSVTILNIFLGMFWYSPLCLGNVWLKAYKFDVKNLKPTPWHYIGAALISLVTVSIIAALICQFKITTWESGMCLALCLWLGLIVTTHFSGVIWAQKPLRAYLIDISYHFVSLLMITEILTVWHR